jgi:preprotein translocase subunit SecA
MKAFESMWDRIGGQVTGAIFRIEQQSPEFVGSLWQISATTHEAPPDETPSATADGNGQSHGGGPPPQADKAIEPIRNFGKRVGRNDPCPCGSGKKYKKCCGA